MFWLLMSPCHSLPRYLLQWRHNGRGNVSNHHGLYYLLNCLFRRKSKKTSKVRITGRCVGSSPANSWHKRSVSRNMFPFNDVILLTVQDKRVIVSHVENISTTSATRVMRKYWNANTFLSSLNTFSVAVVFCSHLFNYCLCVFHCNFINISMDSSFIKSLALRQALPWINILAHNNFDKTNVSWKILPILHLFFWITIWYDNNNNIKWSIIIIDYMI